jgi:hypothetical protein
VTSGGKMVQQGGNDTISAMGGGRAVGGSKMVLRRQR